MEGREAMAFSGGPASYYIHRGGIPGSASATHTGGFQVPPGFRPNPGIPTQSNVRGSSVGSTYPEEPARANYSHGHGHGISTGSSPGVPSSSEPVKKKRGRPRKYGPEGPVSLGLSPMLATANSAPACTTTPSEKRRKGRPPGSGRKQQLSNLGISCENSCYNL